jgi:ABC-type multidrug transport system, ATPase component
MPAIETEQLTKRYGDVVAVESLSLTVEEGEVYGFLGPNGAGKTTTINLLLGLVHRTSGQAEVLGHQVGEEIRDVRNRIGVLPAHSELYDRLTARKHLEFVTGVKEADDDPDAMLERVGIPEAADRAAGEFSTGMAQRLKLAMALVGQPDLLVLDEPTTGLDPNGARQMRQIILEENERGATVFFSSHIMEQVEAVCDRVGVLNQGTMVAEDTVDGLRDTAVGGPQLSVELGSKVDDAAEAIQVLNGVISVSVEGNTVSATLAEPGVKGPAMNAVASSGARIVDFEFSEESLEDVFATLTGEAQEVTA